MLGLFRKNLFINVVFLLLFVIALRAYFFIHPTLNDSTWQFVEIADGNKFLPNSLLQILLSIALIIVQAYLISRIVIEHRMSRVNSLIPGAVFALFACAALEPESMSSILIANLFFVLSLRSLFQIYKKHRPIGTIFNAGFFLGLAVLFYFPYAFYFLAVLLGLNSLRKQDLKELFQLLTGFLAVLFLAGVFFFYNDKLNHLYAISGFHFKWPELIFDNPLFYLKPAATLLLFSVIIGFQNNLRKKKKFDSIKKIELTYWILFIGFIILFFLKKPSEDYFILISTPIAILAGLILESKIGATVKEFVFILFMVLYALLVLNVF